jgi:hypothetical protein
MVPGRRCRVRGGGGACRSGGRQPGRGGGWRSSAARCRWRRRAGHLPETGRGRAALEAEQELAEQADELGADTAPPGSGSGVRRAPDRPPSRRPRRPGIRTSASAPSTAMSCQRSGSGPKPRRDRRAGLPRPSPHRRDVAAHGGLVELEGTRCQPALPGAGQRGSCRALPGAGTFDQLACLEAGAGADSTSLKTIARAAVAAPAPRVTLVRSRRVAKVDSIGFVVRRWTQCSAGKS